MGQGKELKTRSQPQTEILVAFFLFLQVLVLLVEDRHLQLDVYIYDGIVVVVSVVFLEYKLDQKQSKQNVMNNDIVCLTLCCEY